MDKKLKPVPKRIRVVAGGYPEIIKEIDNFFIETKDYLEEKYGKSPSFEIESMNLVQSDNKLTYMNYKDYCVTGVFEKRTEFNNLEYIFFRDFSGLEKSSKQNNNF